MTKLLTTTEAATALTYRLKREVSADTLKAMCRDGRIASHFVGNRYLIEESTLPSVVIAPRGWQKGRSRKADA